LCLPPAGLTPNPPYKYDNKMLCGSGSPGCSHRVGNSAIIENMRRAFHARKSEME